jgi:carbonic anhydrase/acetyltransferase-like protein (isoleucine patch superfamily)
VLAHRVQVIRFVISPLGAVIGEGKVIPDHSLVVGVPAKVIRTDATFEQRGMMNAEAYQNLRKARLLDQKHKSKL